MYLQRRYTFTNHYTVAIIKLNDSYDMFCTQIIFLIDSFWNT